MGLPKFAAFQNEVSGKYLEYVHEGPRKGKLIYSSNNVMSLSSKFELEPAKKAGGYVNIRCCYNNKYLASSKEGECLVTPFLSKPDENESPWACTLYRLDKANGNTYHIYDVGAEGRAYRLMVTDLAQYDCLTTKYANIGHYPDLPPILIDYETLIDFPKHVVLKGDIKQFLRAYWYEGKDYLMFDYDDIGDPKAGHQVFKRGDGSIRIKCDHTNKFWARQPNNWILANYNADWNPNNKDTWFWPIRISNNVVALRNLGNKKFCRRFTHENKTSCLSANSDSIIRESQFEIGEPVISREMYNIRYRTIDGRVYDEKVLTMATEEAANGGTKETSMAVSLKYVVETSKCWDKGVNSSWGGTASITAGNPEVFGVTIEINRSDEKTHTFGETITETKEVVTTYTVNVPPKTRMKVILLATKAKCDVPFSYTQPEVHRDGKIVIADYDDGIYFGVTTYTTLIIKTSLYLSDHHHHHLNYSTLIILQLYIYLLYSSTLCVCLSLCLMCVPLLYLLQWIKL